jgi:uncharacterized protein (TIGR02145 family)
MASQKVNSLEKNFLKNYGLIVEVAYQLGTELVLTTSDENRTLNELNRWCELNGCSKIRYQGTSKVTQKETNLPAEERNELFEKDHISYSEEKLETIKKEIKASSPVTSPSISQPKVLDEKVVKVYQVVASRLLTYDPDIKKELADEFGVLSFKLPYYNLDNSTLTVCYRDNAYYVEFVGSDQSLMNKIVQFRPDQVKLSAKGVMKEKAHVTAGELFTSLVDFICLIQMKSIEFDDGMKLYYAGYNFYTDEVGGNPKYQILSGLESSIFGLVDSVEIGNQTWSDRNLQASFFANGDPIDEARTEEEWLEASANKTPAWCHYLADDSHDETYGKLYNWYAVHDARGLAPKGWKTPSLEDFQKLVTYLGGAGVAAANLKSKEFWENDASGDLLFNAVPGGYRQATGKFDFLNQLGFWWTSSQEGDKAKFITLGQNQPNVTQGDGLKSLGFSVRCLAANGSKEEAPLTQDGFPASNEFAESVLYFKLKVSKIADEYLFLDHIEQGELEGCVRIYTFFDVLRKYSTTSKSLIKEFVRLKNWDANFNYDESNIVSFTALGDEELTKEICLNEDWDDYDDCELQVQILSDGIKYGSSEFTDDFSAIDLEAIYDDCKIISVEATLYKVEIDEEVFYPEDFEKLIRFLS